MTATIWNGATGNWGNAANWSSGVPDARNFDAQISAAGTYTLTIGAMAHFTVGMMEMTAPGATLAVTGRLTVGRTFDLAAGTLSLTFGGVIHGGTLIFDGGAAEFKSGTLDAVHVVGPLDVTRDFNWLNVTHGIDVTTGSGGAGVINLTGRGAVIDFRGSQTFDNGSINLGRLGDFLGGTIINSGTLTLGPHATIFNTGFGAISGATVINEGAINASGLLLRINANDFTNNGIITVSGGTLIASSRNFTNAAGGVIDILAGRNCVIGEGADRLSNLGAINVATGAFLAIDGRYTLANLGMIDNQGSLELRGTLLNQGQTLRLGEGLLAGNVTLQGTIEGGVVVGRAAPSQISGNTLDGVTWRGALRLGSFESVTVENDLTVERRSGAGPGKVFLDGGGRIFFSGGQTLDNAVVHLDGGPGGGSLTVITPRISGNDATLTLGAGLRVVSSAAGAAATLWGTFPARGHTTIINDGRIRAVADGGRFAILPDRFVNNGEMVVGGGDGLYIESKIDTINTGTIRAKRDSLLYISDAGKYERVFGTFTNTGSITIARGGALTLAGSFTVASLGDLRDAGTFELEGILDNTGGTLVLGGGTLFAGRTTILGPFGVIEGGTVVLGRTHMVYRGGFQSGELTNLTFQGVIDLSDAAAGLRLGAGVTVNGADGSGPGLIKLTGAGAKLTFTGSMGIDNLAIRVGNAANADTIDFFSDIHRFQTFTLGAGVRLVSASPGALVNLVDTSGRVDTLVNDGLIVAAAAGGAFAVNVANFTNNGLIEVQGADTLIVRSSLGGTGLITIATGGVLELGLTQAGQTIRFKDGAGALKLDAPAAFAGTIGGFRAGDAIDLAGTLATSATVDAANRLIVSDNGVVVAQLQLSRAYAHASFQVSDDGAGGSLITLAKAPAAAVASTSALHGLVQAMAGFSGPAGGHADETFHPAPPRTHVLAGAHPYA